MKISVLSPAPFFTSLARLGVCVLLCLPLLSAAQMESGQWKTKTRQLSVYFPTPTVSSGSPELLVVPLFGPQRHLLPGGRLLVWVGRNDGTPLADATVTVRVLPDGNLLASVGSRVIELTVHTNADGIAEVFLTAPDIPSDGNSGGGGPAP